MGHWEREIFEKEYADMNWYKGKQAKHVKEMEMGQNGRNLVSIHSPPTIDNHEQTVMTLVK